MQHSPLVVPQYQRSGGETGWAVGCLARPLERLLVAVSIIRVDQDRLPYLVL